MAELVGSAVATEAVGRISSFLSGEKTRHESVEEKAERLEMAVLKIRSVVAVSEDLHISHLPLLHWKAKLKRVAEEGGELLHAQKKQTIECNGVRGCTTGTSISQYLIHAAKRFLPFYRKEDDELDDTILRRFERLADGADSFFRLVESGGHPKASICQPLLTRSLLAGESMEFSLQRGSGNDLIMLCPWLDPSVENGSEACLAVWHEDEVMWQKTFKMMILFRLSEAANVLSIAMTSLELLPPQFGATCAAVKGLLTEIIGKNSSHSYLSAKSEWSLGRMQSYHRYDCESSVANRRADTGLLLNKPVVRVSIRCYASPAMCNSRLAVNNALPLELVCHVSPYLLPEKHSSQFEQIEQDVIRELLPKVTDGFYDHQKQALEYERQTWCPKSSMYCSVAPAISQPLTLSQAYLIENSNAPRRRRRTKSHAMLKSQKIAGA